MKNINIKAMSYSTMLTVILIVFMTIYAELNTKFKDFLKVMSGHHWISKSITSLIFFVVCYYLLMNIVKYNERETKKDVTIVVIITILGALSILLFYAYEFFMV